MTKSELKNGMVVELRNGNRYLVHNDKIMRKDESLYIDSDYSNDNLMYNEDLTRKSKVDGLDIVRVYKSTAICLEDLFLDSALELIWEHKEGKQELSKKDKKFIKKGLKKAQEYCKSLISCKDCEFYEGAYCKFECFSMSTDLGEFFKD